MTEHNHGPCKACWEIDEDTRRFEQRVRKFRALLLEFLEFIEKVDA